MHIAISEAQSRLDPNASLEDNLKTAMKATINHWVCTDEDQQFRSAVGAVMFFYGDESEEYQRLEWELGQLQKVSAIVVAAQAGLAVAPQSLDEDLGKFEAVGLVKIWKGLQA